jgi:ferredoxin
METVFISKLKPFLDAVAENMVLYVPKKNGEHYIFTKYESAAENPVELNNIRTCMPVKEFLFPVRELAATYPAAAEPEKIKPFAVFGLKDCDLQAIKVLDKVFAEEDLQDPFYISRRENMFIISSDCSTPADSCFCNLLGGQGFSTDGFDLNISAVSDGFIIEAGSSKGTRFIEEHSQLFAEVPENLLAERQANRTTTEEQLKQNNTDFELNGTIRDIVQNNRESEIFDAEAKNCIECQACTRVCPTCHCFYLYDARQKDYFAKMKMWDSCMRLSYAAVAGGANPNKILGDRIKHRLLHKFVYFLDRYGLEMCVGCGRCVDADAGGIDLRAVLKKLSAEVSK